MSEKRQKSIPASYLVLIQGTKLLLLRRHNTGYEDGNYSLIAGHVESGETFTQCVIREAQEETGISVQADQLHVVHVMHRDSGTPQNNERIDVFFLADQRAGEITNKEPHMCDDLSWFEMDNLPQNVIPYIRQVLENIRHNIFYSENGWK